MLGGYLTAYLRRYLGEAWRAVAPSVDADIVKRFYTHDPQQYDFNKDHLPALYVFHERAAQNYERLAEDWLLHDVRYRVFWILPPASQFDQSTRSRALEIIAETIAGAIEQGRDPSFVIEGDSDPTAPYEGSVVIRHAGLVSATIKTTQVTKIAIGMASELARDTFEANMYEGVDALIECKKRVQRLPGMNVEHPEWGPFAGGAFTAPSALELVVNDGVADAVLLPGYTMLYVQGGATAQTIGTTPAKLEGFTAAGQAAGLTPDHAEDRVTVQAAGPYNVFATFDVLGTTDRKVTLRLRKNGVAVDGVLGGAKLVEGTASFALSGQVGCADGDELTLYAEADQNSTSLTVVNATWSLTKI